MGPHVTSTTNIILFPIDAPQLLRICGPDAHDARNHAPAVSDAFVRSAALRVSEQFADRFGQDSTRIRVISFDRAHEPATLIPLEELNHQGIDPARLLDIDSFVCLLLTHACPEWDQSCLRVAEDTGLEFWAIGSSDQGDILRQEYAQGQRLDGYFADNRFGVNEAMFVDLFRAVEACS
ncbi:MAG: hypothetical protein A3D16_03785 [Rhodobacterales bacterium RIFCSPHIGHO2_02_FULL_62_130]|nr:MAG: hypothetical protein A2Z55_05045 [Burkholderiales bacterium RIFCSPHIGHO2_12_63_9]OHC54079.1 MAG: hypothetical protein A3D16_03785 [Rhodobacterales bacterium RIFCSPHIGHO2_02_FULL_62_130]OHC56041.1 MAG: hypothetical protein A3E48_09155 [Rhodobacterales bacterium RIFCSPHIGHO2_12_FULL_62_75]HCY99844.1 hypothetical protein [Rhodobacter sp.]